MPEELGSHVPGRLQHIYECWNTQGRPPQQGIKWNLASWRAFLPEFSELFDRLPNPIDRGEVIAHAARANGEGKSHEAFVASMVWGYGRVGYGPFRTARVLAENADADETLCKVVALVRSDGGSNAFAWLAGNRLKWLGVAFATKYLYLCSADSPPAPALVLDRVVQGWLRQHADLRVRLDWHVADYRRYVDAVTEWAAELEIAPADVEYLIFADAAAADATSQWAAFAAPSDANVAGTPGRILPPESVAVLEALDEAADAFAALPPNGDPADTEDFEQGLRQLRRIVLARTI